MVTDRDEGRVKGLEEMVMSRQGEEDGQKIGSLTNRVKSDIW